MTLQDYDAICAALENGEQPAFIAARHGIAYATVFHVYAATRGEPWAKARVKFRRDPFGDARAAGLIRGGEWVGTTAELSAYLDLLDERAAHRARGENSNGDEPMADLRTVGERVRAELDTKKAAEDAERERWAARGREIQAQREAERLAQEQARTAATREMQAARAAELDAQLRARALGEWIQAGGAPGDFETQWTAIRDEYRRRAVVEKLLSRKAAIDAGEY